MVYYFTFKINDEIQYRTQVQSLQCADNTKKGMRCKRNCVIGSPFSATHLAYNHHLRIKPSQIPNAGKGLYCCDPLSSDSHEVLFKKGETIVKYVGELINHAELVERYSHYTPPYVVGVSANSYEDGARICGIGSLANTNPGHQNATLSVYNGKASLKATKNIKNGEEIYLSYGREYRLHQPEVTYATTIK